MRSALQERSGPQSQVILKVRSGKPAVSFFYGRVSQMTHHANYPRWTVLEALAIMELARIVEPTNSIH
jgi:hypothetical protein